jgi:hypothetical protein
MSNGADAFKDLFGQFTGDDGKEYRCVECKYPLVKIVVKTVFDDPKKLFYCKRNICTRFGFITVVAKK